MFSPEETSLDHEVVDTSLLSSGHLTRSAALTYFNECVEELIVDERDFRGIEPYKDKNNRLRFRIRIAQMPYGADQF